MKKRIMTTLLASAMILSIAGCGNSTPATTTAAPAATTTAAAAGNDAAATDAPADTQAAETEAAAPAGDEGKVFNIYAWNDEFKGFFEKYFTAQVPMNDAGEYFENAPGKKYVDEGVTFNWIINPSDGGVYQEKLDTALLGQADAAADDKVDMFLAEADYILKYTDTEATMDIAKIGVKQLDTEYQYTVSAASDANGAIKGVSFQCCPSALIYRRSIAKEVLGTDDPAEVQEKLGDWDKFNAVAATAKDLGYKMTASYVETFRVFDNNKSSAWVVNGELNIDESVKTWLAQAKEFWDNGYTLDAGIWDDAKTAEMFADGKTMCFFGPAWYFNFCMGNAQDPEKGCYGDWAICEGPQAHFWGGTWILAAEGTDNPTILADVLNAFTANEEVCSALIENEAQFTNNKAVNEKYANDPDFGNAFLGGQNDTAVFVGMADNIRFDNKTGYDQLLSEKFPSVMIDYIKGNISEEDAYKNYYQYVNETYPAVVTP